jgi:DNA replication initiation complex subunit (GINS family)
MNTLKRFVDNFRFSSSKTPTQSIFEGISTIENLLNDIDGSLASDDANYQEQKSLISQIENITKKLISERKGLVVEKNKLTVQIAEAKNERETKLVSAVEKQEYDKIINGLKGTLKEIVRRIGVIDSTLKLQKPSKITRLLQNLLKLNKSIEPDNQSHLYTVPINPDAEREYNEREMPTPIVKEKQNSVLGEEFQNGNQNFIDEDEFKDTTEEPTKEEPTKEEPTKEEPNNENNITWDDLRMKGGYRYPTSSSSRKNKYKKSSRNASITRGGKRKHTRKHNKKGGNKRKHGRKSHKARK